ncbi:MAG: hypothetical protein IAE91_11925 [Ignavibacteriaceae bacterium]|nr:hypothetical protein [Ignavibacteriaceae bacterium]
MIDPYLLFEDSLIIYKLEPALTEESKDNYFVDCEDIIIELEEKVDFSESGFEEIGYSLN